MMDILNMLSREDKWFLSDGKAVAFTPEFPEFLNNLGFWDKIAYINFTIEAPFAITLLCGNEQVKLEQTKYNWRPDRIKCQYSSDSLSITEYKTVINSSLNSELNIINESNEDKKIDIV